MEPEAELPFPVGEDIVLGCGVAKNTRLTGEDLGVALRWAPKLGVMGEAQIVGCGAPDG